MSRPLDATGDTHTHTHINSNSSFRFQAKVHLLFVRVILLHPCTEQALLFWLVTVHRNVRCLPSAYVTASPPSLHGGCSTPAVPAQAGFHEKGLRGLTTTSGHTKGFLWLADWLTIPHGGCGSSLAIACWPSRVRDKLGRKLRHSPPSQTPPRITWMRMPP
ncbi:hypothetical protein BJV74DRAFT_613447 [Russula compacta]|nr:hypothetical protein BJV74DRAFT_613447 [Russula compacta]